MSKIIVLCEHDGQNIKPSTLNTVRAASEIGQDITLAIFGANISAVSTQAQAISQVKQIVAIDSNDLTHPLPEIIAPTLAKIVQEMNATHLLAPATTFGKNILPCVAALLDVQQISDIIKVHSADSFDRPIYAGNAIATVESSDKIKVITVRTTGFDAVAVDGGNASVANANLEKTDTSLSKFVSQELSKSERPELTAADIIVSGGRGLGSAENFAIIEKLADKLGAAVGASRAAVDAGYVPNDYQVGQTGKVVAPSLYIAVGISGAIQHLAGMKDSKVIVAINKDEEAAIFQVADYGLVADLFEAVPALEGKL